MAIYRHVGDREQLLGLVLDEVSASFPLIELPKDPRERIITLLGEAFDVLVGQRWIAEALRAGNPGGAGALWLVDRILEAAAELGLDTAPAFVMYRALWNYTLGSVLTTAAEVNRAGAPSAIEQKVDAIGADALPYLAAALRTASATDRKAAYRHGIGHFITGYTARETGEA
jgi:Tetracyclin repressor-like, C-terminal domain